MPLRLAEFLLLNILLVPIQPARAQKRGVLVDMSNHQRVDYARLYTNTGDVVTSDSLGRFVITKPFESVTISHQRYTSRVLNRAEMRDTVELLPRSVNLNEVIIVAKAPSVKIPMSLNPTNDPLLKKPSPSGNDFLGWLKVFEKGHISGKEDRRRKKAIENY